MAANPEKVVKVDMGCEIQDAEKLISGIRARGFAVELTQDGGLAVTPASKLQPHEREVIRSNRAAIVDYLTAANDPQADADRWAWPHSDAMNGSELALMATRLERFARIAMDVDQAERMSDKLLIRDREHDDRHLCLECQHCQHGRCSNSRAAGLRQPELGTDYALELKRCNGFAPGQGTLAYGNGTANAARLVQQGRAPGPWLTASETAASKEYHAHHGQCQQCQAAGRGYTSHCSTGLALWNQYQQEGAIQ